MPNIIIPSEIDGDRVYPLPDEGRVTIGRSLDRDITLMDRRVSSLHAEILCRNGEHVLRDLDSTNGTFISGKQIVQHTLQPGDEVICGQTLLVFSNLETYAKTARLVAGPGFAPYKHGEPIAIDLHEIEQSFISNSGTYKRMSPERKIEILYRLSQEVASIENLEALLDRVADVIVGAIQADRVFILLSEPGAHTHLVPRVIRKRSGIKDHDGLPISMTLVNRVIEEGHALITQDALCDSRFTGGTSILKFDIRSAIAVPLRAKDRVIGVICLDKVQPGSCFSDEDLQLLVLIANHAAQSIVNARLYAQALLAIGDLRKAKEEILRWNYELERKVEDRTRELSQRNVDILELSKQKDELLGMVAHDLRSPLTSIIGFSDIALQRLAQGKSGPKVSEDIETIRAVGQEMADLIHDLLDAAKVEAGKVAIRRVPGAVRPVLVEVSRMMEPMAVAKGLTMQLDCPEGLPDTPIDPHRLAQVVTNLVQNAIKFSRKGDEVVVGARAVPEGVEVSIRDTGPGIALEEQERIFRAWERGRNPSTEKEKGVGLGLAIARKLVRLHDSDIVLHSKPGVGSCFSFVLPSQAKSLDGQAQPQMD